MSRQPGAGHRVTSLFQKADIFTGPIYLNIRGRPTMATTLGGLLSLALVLILLTQATIQILQMVKHTDPNILQMTEFYDDPNAIYLNKSNNFIFAVSTTIDGKFVPMQQRSLFQFTGTFTQYYRNTTTGDRPKYYSNISFAPCNESDFSAFPAGTYVTYNLSQAYCPKFINHTFPNGTCPDFIVQEHPDCITDLEFVIRGTYLSTDFEFIQFNVNLCNETDPNRPWKLECDSVENIVKYFDQSTIKWNLYFANTLLNPVQYDPANKTFFDSLYWDMVLNNSKIADILLDQTTIVTHDSYYSSAARPNETFYNIDPSRNREQFTHNAGQFPILQWNLRRSNYNMVTVRTYMKIQDILANIGGFSKSIMFVMAIVAAGYVKYKYQMMLSNELYNYDVPKGNYRSANNSRSSDRSEDHDEYGHPKRKSRNASLSMQQNLLNHDTHGGDVPYSNQSEEDKIKKFFAEEKLTNRKIGYNEGSYFFAKFFRCCKRKSYDDVLSAKARDYVERDIDIIHLVQKVQELDKLKMVLLTSDQRQLFHYVPKPMITEAGDTPVERDASIMHHHEEIQPYVDDGEAGRDDNDRVVKFANLYMSYRKVSRDNDVSRATSNRRLLNLIGEDLIRVFQKVDKEVGDNPDPRHLQNVLWRYIAADKKKNQ